MKALRTYLSGRKKSDFADAIGIAPAYLSQILSEKTAKRPSFDLMVRIERATCGEVPVSSWVVHEASSKPSEVAE